MLQSESAVIADSVAGDTVISDSVISDSMTWIGEGSGLVLVREEVAKPEMRADQAIESAQSWTILALLLFFAAVCIRIKNNGKYLRALVSDLTDVRERHNAFDDTVRETSLLFMLNILWSCCVGVILYSTLVFVSLNPDLSTFNSQLSTFNSVLSSLRTPLSTTPGACIAVCCGIGLLYTGVMTLAYTLVGNVFSDAVRTRMWVKGFAAAQALSTFILFPIALVLLCLPGWPPYLLIAAATTFIIAKIIFICKGFRIFFTQLSSYVLFLYYLCSLEIVPLILCWLAAVGLCSIL